MRFKIPNYNGEYKVVSLSLDEKTKQELLKENVEFIQVLPHHVEGYPGEWLLSRDDSIVNKFRECNNFDVFEIYEDGMTYRCYDDSIIENTFFITEKCNSNCIMCPSPNSSRKRGNIVKIDDLINIASHVPSDVSHITITGGEPFMAGKDLFRLLEYCRRKFEHTEFQILTNGRIFAVNEYCELLLNTIPNHTMLGIPLHGSCQEVHDRITQTHNSFRQTITGLKRIQKMGVQNEIRIVVCRENANDISKIAKLIAAELSRVNYVSIMAMEMTGSAYINANKVWISYRESFAYVRPAIDILLRNGIDVRLYNFPLCTVDRDYRMLCARSISSWKIRYSNVCEKCTVKESCGGVFAGTFRLESEELETIL